MPSDLPDRIAATRRSTLSAVSALAVGGCLGSQPEGTQRQTGPEPTETATPVRTRIPKLLSADHDSPAERPLEALNGSGPASEDRTYVEDEGTIEGRKYAGIKFDLTLDRGGVFEGEITATVPEGDESHFYSPNTVTFSTAGTETESIYLRWEDFDRPKAVDKWVSNIKRLRFSGSYADGEDGSVTVENARLVKGDALWATCPRRGKAAPAGETVTYEVTVSNLREESLGVQARLEPGGWETMDAAVAPSALELEPEETDTVEVTVTPSQNVPTGGFERHQLQLLPDGENDAAVSMELVTSRRLESPNIVHDAEGWQGVRDKVENYDWAAQKRDARVQRASDWSVPTSRAAGDGTAERGTGIFSRLKTGKRAYNAAIAWQLTREPEYAEKVVTLLERLTHPEHGYPATRKAVDSNTVKNALFFSNVAKAYDTITDSGLIGETLAGRFEDTVYLFAEDSLKSLRSGWMANQSTSLNAAVIYCGLAIDDMEIVNRYITMPGGMIDRFAAGFMPDGWWFEGAINYNILVTDQFLHLAIALDRRGIDWVDKSFPIKTAERVDLRPDTERDPKDFAGINYEQWGPMDRTSLTLKDVFEGLLPFMDYRGVVFATNDTHGNQQVGGQNFEVAYYLYGASEFLPTLNRLDPSDRNLLYGVPELPEPPDNELQPYERSVHRDNIGYHVLRSQNDRPVENRIQAALKYGIHGGHHGHYDRCALTCLYRNGRNVGHPGEPWFSYVPVFYKCGCQASLTHNMVLVDQKMQYPTESEPPLLFHSGDLFQAGAVENNAPWSYMPPRNQDPLRNGNPLSSLSRYMPEFPDAPDNYNELTGFTESIRNRRVLVVTDDYVVLADDLSGESEHNYDHTLWIKGLQEIEAPTMTQTRHDAQLDDDPRKPAQMSTNVDWYEVEGTLRADYSYEVRGQFAGFFNNEAGPSKYSVFHAWPEGKREVATCEFLQQDFVTDLQCRLEDSAGETIADDEVSAWVIGKGEVAADVSGESAVTLAVDVASRKGGPCLFWKGAVVTADDERIPLADVSYTAENARESAPTTEDYEGGRITHAGERLERAVPAEPADTSSPSRLTFDLGDVDAARIEASVACDFPVGEATERRRGLIARQTGDAARFLSVIEPYEDESVVESVTADSGSELTVELTDGRTHELEFTGLDSEDGDVAVTMRERDGGDVVGEERT